MGDYIFNGFGSPPTEYLEYRYRAKFGLSNVQMQAEPLDKFYMNLEIMGLENKKEEEEYKKAERKNGKH